MRPLEPEDGLVVVEAGRQVQVVNGATSGSSNNSPEVLSVLNATSWIETCAPTMPVIVWTDSAHVVEGCNRWRLIWRGNDWKRIRSNSHNRCCAIPDAKLWQQLDVLLERNPQIRIELCKGHSGIPGNDHADIAARAALTSIRQAVMKRAPARSWCAPQSGNGARIGSTSPFRKLSSPESVPERAAGRKDDDE